MNTAIGTDRAVDVHQRRGLCRTDGGEPPKYFTCSGLSALGIARSSFDGGALLGRHHHHLTPRLIKLIELTKNVIIWKKLADSDQN